MKQLLILIVCAVAIAFADSTTIPVTCISVDGVVHSISDINQPSLTFHSNGTVTASSGYSVSDFSGVDFLLLESAAQDTKYFGFTTETFNADIAKHITRTSLGMAKTCVQKTRADGIAFLNKQKAAYVIFNNIDTGLETWSHFSRKDSVKIATEGGRLADSVIVIPHKVDAISASNEGYTCGPDRFDWISAFDEVAYHVHQWEASRDWNIGNPEVSVLTIGLLMNYMPDAPSCVPIQNIPRITKLIEDQLESVKCEDHTGKKVKKYYPCT